MKKQGCITTEPASTILIFKRFLDTDPAGQGFTPYAYVLNNPISYIDPSGMFIDQWFRDLFDALSGFFTDFVDNVFDSHPVYRYPGEVVVTADRSPYLEHKAQSQYNEINTMLNIDGLNFNPALINASSQINSFDPIDADFSYGLTPDVEQKQIELDRDVKQYKMTTKKGSYLQYEAKYVNKTRTHGYLIWYDLNGKQIGRYEAVSGSGSPKYYSIPFGDWEASYLNTEYHEVYSRHGVSFRITLGPDKYDPLRGRKTKNMRIHPARYLGTEGCIGLIGKKTEIMDFYNRYSNYYNKYGRMPVYVIYK